MLDKNFEKLAEEAYAEMGISPKAFSKDGKALDIFSLLKIKPRVNEDNKRVITPYEILGVPPQFDDEGNEIPIVFAIKNPIFKVSKTKDSFFQFIYKPDKEKSEDSVIDTLKFNYKKALFSGNDADAEMYFKLLDEASGGKAKEILADFYNYTKFYKKMKKQLLIDIFAHFFLMYVSKKSTVKNGITKKGKLFRAYKLKSQSLDSEVYELDNDIFPTATEVNSELAIISSIKITKIADDEFVDVKNTETPEEVVNRKHTPQSPVVETETVLNEAESESKGIFEHIKSRINFKRANRKMRLRAHHLFAPAEPKNYTQEEEEYIKGVEEKANNLAQTGAKEEYKVLT